MTSFFSDESHDTSVGLSGESSGNAPARSAADDQQERRSAEARGTNAARLESVLTATSLTPIGDQVVDAALRIAGRTGADLRLLHAFPAPAFPVSAALTLLPPRMVEAQRERCQKLLEQQLLRLGAPLELGDEAIIASGAPHRLLAREAERLGVDMVVVGAADNRRSGVLGLTTDRTLRSVAQPVLIARNGFDLPLERVLAPVDLSFTCGRSLRRGLALVEHLAAPDMRVEGLLVLRPEELTIVSSLTADELCATAGGELERFLAAHGGEYRLAPTVRIGQPQEVILERLREMPADLVIVGTHGRSNFERFLLGRIALHVARNAPCSVLIVPPPGAQPIAGSDGNGNGNGNGNGRHDS